MSSYVADFNTRNRILTFSQFYRRHNALVSNFNVRLKFLLKQDLSELEFYCVLVNKFRKIAGRNDFSDQFKKISIRNKRTGYNMKVMRQTACLIVSPIVVDNFAALVNCTPASDLIMVHVLPFVEPSGIQLLGFCCSSVSVLVLLLSTHLVSSQC